MISSASASPQWLPAARPDGKLWKGFIAQKLRDVIGALRGRIAKHQRHDGRGLVTHTAGWSTPDDPARNIERAHGVKLVFHQTVPPILPSDRFDELVVTNGDLVLVGMLRAEILVYDDALMDALSKDPRVHFKPIAAVLKEAADDIRQMSCAEARATHETLRAYYLSTHRDADARFAALVEQACVR